MLLRNVCVCPRLAQLFANVGKCWETLLFMTQCKSDCNYWNCVKRRLRVATTTTTTVVLCCVELILMRDSVRKRLCWRESLFERVSVLSKVSGMDHSSSYFRKEEWGHNCQPTNTILISNLTIHSRSISLVATTASAPVSTGGRHTHWDR